MNNNKNDQHPSLIEYLVDMPDIKKPTSNPNDQDISRPRGLSVRFTSALSRLIKRVF